MLPCPDTGNAIPGLQRTPEDLESPDDDTRSTSRHDRNSDLQPVRWLPQADAQTYPNLEIVVSDNCSPDRTEEYVRGHDDPRIRYFRQEPALRPNDNFNFCLEQASGAYFLLLHDDDMIDSDFVEACMSAAEYRTDVGLIRTGMRRMDAHSKVLRDHPNGAGGLSTEEFFLAWYRGQKTPMHLCASHFNTEKLREIGGLNSRHQLFQDVLAEVRLAAMYGRIDIQEPKCSFRTHAAARAHAHTISAWCEDSVMLLDAMCDLVPEASRKRVRGAGMKFFANHNYRLARQVQQPMGRLLARLRVFKTFDLPSAYFVERAITRLRRMGRRLLGRKGPDRGSPAST